MKMSDARNAGMGVYRERAKMHAAMSDLESRIDHPLLKSRIEHEAIYEFDDALVVYRAAAFNIFFEGFSVRGNAELKRIERTKEIKKKFVSWFPPKRADVGVLISKEVWKIEAQPDHPGCAYFISDGKSTNQRNYGYRHKLVNEAVKKGIILSDKLLDAVFDPIDAQLMDFYRKIKVPGM
ncbi:hypothetical protein HZB03_03070 [Candidatus Woesearchaeota archaeon]|nr:hypothetical protein [Candidatus Woesearchaeota archaeon]